MMASVMYYKNLKFELDPEVYEPHDDTFLILDNLNWYLSKDLSVLDMGTGIGIIAIVAALKSKEVLGVDINEKAVNLAKKNAKLNQISNVRFRISNLFSNISNLEQFDLIIFNPPYLPVEDSSILGTAWSGGENGIKVVIKFLRDAKRHLRNGGKILLLLSSLSDLHSFHEFLTRHGYFHKIIARKKLFFEELFLYELTTSP